MSFIKDIFFGGAEKEAAAARTAGITEGVGESRRQFDLTREDFAAGIERGDVAGEERLALLGLRGEEASAAALGRLTESPGQVFLRERQERARLRGASALGELGGGNIRTQLEEDAFARSQTQLQDRLDRLGGIDRSGLSQVGQQAGVGANISGNIANLFAERGESRGAGIESVANARRSGLARVAGAFI